MISIKRVSAQVQGEGGLFPPTLSDEVRRAELHLNDRDDETGSMVVPTVLALALGAMVMMFFASQAVFAAPTPPSTLVTEAPLTHLSAAHVVNVCPVHLKNVQFSGSFRLESGEGKTGRELRFVIGQPEVPGNVGAKSTESVAQIWEGKQCEASCSSIAFERGDLSMPIALDLQCRSERVGALSAHVALLWSHGPAPSTSIRFGSWIEGYQESDLKVDVDQFNTTAAVAQRTSEQPVVGRVARLAAREDRLGTH